MAHIICFKSKKRFIVIRNFAFRVVSFVWYNRQGQKVKRKENTQFEENGEIRPISKFRLLLVTFCHFVTDYTDNVTI